jgi:hypothetical protein
MDRLRFPSGCTIADPIDRLRRFCRDEYDLYDGVADPTPERVTPLDVAITVAVSARVDTAVRFRTVTGRLGPANGAVAMHSCHPSRTAQCAATQLIDRGSVELHARRASRGIINTTPPIRKRSGTSERVHLPRLLEPCVDLFFEDELERRCLIVDVQLLDVWCDPIWLGLRTGPT